MTKAGWFFMCISWAVIIGLFAFALARNLRRRT